MIAQSSSGMIFAFTVLLTHSALLSELPPNHAATISIETDWASIASEPTENLGPRAKPKNVANVIYISGSTGRPKGCVVTHSNVTRLFTATDHWFSFGLDDTGSLFHSTAFEFSVWEIWGALLHGGKARCRPADHRTISRAVSRTAGPASRNRPQSDALSLQAPDQSMPWGLTDPCS
jgi:non-ribosomal peptide synthetase component F